MRTYCARGTATKRCAPQATSFWAQRFAFLTLPVCACSATHSIAKHADALAELFQMFAVDDQRLLAGGQTKTRGLFVHEDSRGRFGVAAFNQFLADEREQKIYQERLATHLCDE